MLLCRLFFHPKSKLFACQPFISFPKYFLSQYITGNRAENLQGAKLTGSKGIANYKKIISKHDGHTRTCLKLIVIRQKTSWGSIRFRSFLAGKNTRQGCLELYAFRACNNLCFSSNRSVKYQRSVKNFTKRLLVIGKIFFVLVKKKRGSEKWESSWLLDQ